MWGRDGGLHPDAAALQTLFTVDQADPLAEDLVVDLLTALGITGLPEEPQQTTRTRRRAGARSGSARPRNPLDRAINDHAVPLLEAAGATRRGRRFRITDPRGNAVLLDFQGTTPFAKGAVAFFLRYQIIPAVLRDWERSNTDERVDDFDLRGICVSGIYTPPDLRDPWCSWRDGDDRWEFDPTDGVSGAVLERVLREVAIPRLTALLDPLTLLDAGDDWWQMHIRRGDITRFMLLLDFGPTSELARMWTTLDDELSSELRHWAENRLRDRFGVSPDWRHGIPVGIEPGSPRDRLRPLVDRHLAPLLADAGFSRGPTFRQVNDLGDELVVDVCPAFSAIGGDDLVFAVETSIMPAMLQRWHQRATSITAPIRPMISARGGWCLQRITPPTRYTGIAAHVALGLDLWRCTAGDIDSCARALADAVRARLPELSRLLDRDHLLALATDPDGDAAGFTAILPRREILLRLDVDPADDVLALARRVETDPVLANFEADFLPWARSMLRG